MAHYCFVSAQYLPTPGGVERYTYQLAKELTARGHQVSIITSALNGLPEKELTDENLLIWRVPGLSLMKGRLPIAFYGRRLRRVFREAMQAPDTRLIIQTRFYPLSLWAVSFAARHRVPYIVIEHGAGHLKMAGPLATVFSELYEHGAMQYVKWHKPRFYAVSQSGADWLSHFGVNAQGVLYNGLNLEEVGRLTAEGRALAQQLPLPNLPLVVFSGRMVPEKRIHSLLQAVEAINSPTPRIFLLAAGDGPLNQPLQKTGSASALFTGNLPQSCLFALLETAPYFCLPSDSEGMPTAVLEAAALGCYVITTGNGGAKELILSGDYGCILPENSAAEIQKALEYALENPESCRQAARRAQHRTAERFTFKNTCDALEQVPFL